jgi:hypothetical protein
MVAEPESGGADVSDLLCAVQLSLSYTYLLIIWTSRLVVLSDVEITFPTSASLDPAP